MITLRVSELASLMNIYNHSYDNPDDNLRALSAGGGLVRRMC